MINFKFSIDIKVPASGIPTFLQFCVNGKEVQGEEHHEAHPSLGGGCQ